MSEAALRERVEYLEAENAELKRQLRMDPDDEFVMRARKYAGLTRKQAMLLWTLWSCRPMSRDQIYFMIWGLEDGPDIKIIDALMCRVRAVVRPMGAIIDTVWGHGYQLSPDSRAKIAVLIGIEVQP